MKVGLDARVSTQDQQTLVLQREAMEAQIPPDLVVKFQLIDIVDVIL
jgi:RNase P/RNase MRP subunit p29